MDLVQDLAVADKRKDRAEDHVGPASLPQTLRIKRKAGHDHEGLVALVVRQQIAYEWQLYAEDLAVEGVLNGLEFSQPFTAVSKNE